MLNDPEVELTQQDSPSEATAANMEAGAPAESQVEPPVGEPPVGEPQVEAVPAESVTSQAVVLTFPNGLPPLAARDLREFLRARSVRVEGL